MPNGKTLTFVSIEIEARDNRGRFYEAKSGLGSKNSESTKVTTYVSDPAAGIRLMWDSKSSRAVLYQTPVEAHRKLNGCWADQQGRVREGGPEDGDWHPIPVAPASTSQSKVWIREPDGARRQVLLNSENLGTKTISGFTVWGLRMNYAPLPGDKPNETTESSAEFWKSDALNLKLSEESAGGGNQASTYAKTKELIDLKVGEPDPSLFSPPKSYRVDRVDLHQVSCDQE